MSGKSVIIVGAGIAGLSTGCYARMNGYHTHIFEQHKLPGGVCTSWQRQGYTIDGCIDWLMGSSPGSSLYRMYQEVGALQGNRLIIRDHWCRYLDEITGQSLDLSADLGRLAADLHALAPEDHALIDEFMATVHRLRGLDMPMDQARELMGPLDGLKMAWSMRSFLTLPARYHRPMSEFAARARSTFLRWFLLSLTGPQMPAVLPFSVLAALADGSLSVVEGGSLRFAQAMEKRYKGLGGEVTYRASVEEVLVEDDRAVGVRLADGSTHRADYVVSAADGYSTIFKLLGGRYVDRKIRDRYDHWPRFEPILIVSFGVADSLTGYPATHCVRLQRALTVAGREIADLGYRISNNDPTLAPPGKTVVQSLIGTDYDYWSELLKERPRYDAEKARVATELLERLEPHLPGISARVEVTDVATPCTLERYTRNHRGCYEGWLVTPETFGARIARTLPGLANFYMAGQWVEVGGGIPPVVAHGRHIAQLLCRRDGRRFVATTP